ncbi:unnamed protein product [Urochloa humidicola]
MEQLLEAVMELPSSPATTSPGSIAANASPTRADLRRSMTSSEARMEEERSPTRYSPMRSFHPVLIGSPSELGVQFQNNPVVIPKSVGEISGKLPPVRCRMSCLISWVVLAL